MTERISHAEALALVEALPVAYNTRTALLLYVRQQQALEADTVSRAEHEAALDRVIKQRENERDSKSRAAAAYKRKLEELEAERDALKQFDHDAEKHARHATLTQNNATLQGQLTALQSELERKIEEQRDALMGAFRRREEEHERALATERARAEEAERDRESLHVVLKNAVHERDRVTQKLKLDIAFERGRADGHWAELAAANARVVRLEARERVLRDFSEHMKGYLLVEDEEDRETALGAARACLSQYEHLLSTAPQASTVAYERVAVTEAERRLDGEIRRLEARLGGLGRLACDTNESLRDGDYEGARQRLSDGLRALAPSAAHLTAPQASTDSSPKGQKAEKNDERDGTCGLRRVRGLHGVEEFRRQPDAAMERASGEDSGGVASRNQGGDELDRALAAAARRIGELEETIADVADGFDQQGKRGLASQLRQFLPSATAPQASTEQASPSPEHENHGQKTLDPNASLVPGPARMEALRPESLRGDTVPRDGAQVVPAQDSDVAEEVASPSPAVGDVNVPTYQDWLRQGEEADRLAQRAVAAAQPAPSVEAGRVQASAQDSSPSPASPAGPSSGLVPPTEGRTATGGGAGDQPAPSCAVVWCRKGGSHTGECTEPGGTERCRLCERDECKCPASTPAEPQGRPEQAGEYVPRAELVEALRDPAVGLWNLAIRLERK